MKPWWFHFLSNVYLSCIYCNIYIYIYTLHYIICMYVYMHTNIYLYIYIHICIYRYRYRYLCKYILKSFCVRYQLPRICPSRGQAAQTRGHVAMTPCRRSRSVAAFYPTTFGVVFSFESIHTYIYIYIYIYIIHIIYKCIYIYIFMCINLYDLC